ncbi:MAG: hypothetical protein AB8B79_06295 [Granulosicoccus sp.]
MSGVRNWKLRRAPIRGLLAQELITATIAAPEMRVHIHAEIPESKHCVTLSDTAIPNIMEQFSGYYG